MTEEGHLVVGRYRLSRRLGTGAMGVVWEGHDERLNRPVAVKKLLLQPGLPPSKAAEAVARCLREGRIAARLHHANAIAVFDVVDEDDMPCLVMEYMRSRSLATVMAEDGLLPPVRAADVGAQVAAALAAAHAAGIVHRDVTPGNILLGDNGVVKITDFGISRVTDDATATNTGVFAGTPAYLAPEVALGEEPTPASDLFSLGSALYAAVEGEPPFGRAANTLGLLHAVAGGRINPPQRSGPLTDVLTALLDADPHARPTAAEARDLLAAVGGGRISALVPLPVVEAASATASATAATASTTASATAGTGPVGEGTAVMVGSTAPVRRAPGGIAPAARARGPLAVAGVFLVALVAAGIWLLGDRDGLLPTEDRAPANGTVHTDTTPTEVSEVVAPVRGGGGQPAKTGQAPVPSTGEPAPVATETAEPPSSTTATTTPPPATTTSNALDPTTEESTPPPAGGDEETVTAPASTAAAVD